MPPSHTHMIEPGSPVARVRPVGICLVVGALDLCVTNHHMISYYTYAAAYCSSSERARERGILLIVLSLPALQVSDDLRGLTRG